jgi:hypothetical protein
MEMKLSKLAYRVEKQALRTGGKILDGKKFETFDSTLLEVGEGDIDDHHDAQSSGQLYFGMVVRKAIEDVQNVKTKFDNWFSKVYDECNELIKAETGIKRPNKVDVENRVRQEYSDKYNKYMNIIRKKNYIYERLNIWYSAWLSKGFNLSDLSARKSKQIGRDTRSLVGKRSVRDEEDEEE